MNLDRESGYQEISGQDTRVSEHQESTRKGIFDLISGCSDIHYLIT